jgi:hypothetical protein
MPPRFANSLLCGRCRGARSKANLLVLKTDVRIYLSRASRGDHNHYEKKLNGLTTFRKWLLFPSGLVPSELLGFSVVSHVRPVERVQSLLRIGDSYGNTCAEVNDM